MVLCEVLPRASTAARYNAWSEPSFMMTLVVALNGSSEMYSVTVFLDCVAPTRLEAKSVDLFCNLNPTPASRQSMTVVRRHQLVGCFSHNERSDVTEIVFVETES